MPDQEIIEACLAGDEQSWDLVRAWVSEVVHARLWLDGVSADDIISDTLLKLLLNFRARRFRHESSLKTYTQQITRYTLISTIRRHARGMQPACDPAKEQPDPMTPLQTLEEMEQAEVFERVFALIDARCKEIWHMIFAEQLQYSEIGRRLDMTENAVKGKVFRCKEEAIAIRKRLY
jgi:RNA polymerase sigma factor (sigma-70 family)